MTRMRSGDKDVDPHHHGLFMAVLDQLLEQVR